MQPRVGIAVATADGWSTSVAHPNTVELVAAVEERFRPRWVFWGRDIETMLVDGGLRVSKCWDIAAVQRLLVGGWRMDPARAWAMLHDLSSTIFPSLLPLTCSANPTMAVRTNRCASTATSNPSGWRPEFDWTTERLGRWAQLAATAATLQDAKLAGLTDRPNAASTARSESAAELLCAELSSDGLPMDRSIAESIVASFVGPRPQERSGGDRAAKVPRRGGVAPLDQRRLRSAQSSAGEITAAQHRRRTARHACVASRSDPRHASVDRRAPGVAQGRTDCDDVRLRLARREPRHRMAVCEASGRRAMALRVA